MNYDNLSIFKIWAPDNAEWTAWAKPVLFAGMSSSCASALNIPEAQVALDFKTMIIVDLPGAQSVSEALAFAQKGYRPVPLYNGTMGSEKMLVNVRKVSDAMFSAADTLKTLPLRPDSPPVFMLDSDRMNGSKEPGSYDNRWCVFSQDMPSPAYLKSKGIHKIIVKTMQNIQTDLERILYDYQKNGILLYALRNNTDAPKELTVNKQFFMTGWAYRFKVTAGLKRNATGGFGGKIPDVYENGSSGGHYYRYG